MLSRWNSIMSSTQEYRELHNERLDFSSGCYDGVWSKSRKVLEMIQWRNTSTKSGGPSHTWQLSLRSIVSKWLHFAGLVLDDMLRADFRKHILSAKGDCWIMEIHTEWQEKQKEMNKVTAFVKRWTFENWNWSVLHWDRIIRSSFFFPDETSGSWHLARP